MAFDKAGGARPQSHYTTFSVVPLMGQPGDIRSSEPRRIRFRTIPLKLQRLLLLPQISPNRIAPKLV
jgi:hypothetical protein